jgi:hypothetical protein
MTDGELLVSSGAESDAGDFLMRRLPPWMSDDHSKGNFKLLDVVGRAFDRIDDDIRDVDNATTVQNAETVAQLEALAALVDLPHKQGEPREKYRSRLVAEYQTMTTETVARDVIENAATILDITKDDIGYSELNEHGVVNLSIPAEALSSLSLSSTEFVNIISKHSAAGFRIEATERGTFTFASEAAYTGSMDTYEPSNHADDPEHGYATLDQNGTPTDTGGTYSGLIE